MGWTRFGLDRLGVRTSAALGATEEITLDRVRWTEPPGGPLAPEAVLDKCPERVRRTLGLVESRALASCVRSSSATRPADFEADRVRREPDGACL